MILYCTDLQLKKIVENMRRLSRKLSIDIHESIHEESYIANDDVFIKDNVAINSTGIAIRDNPKTFTLVYDEIEMVRNFRSVQI